MFLFFDTVIKPVLDAANPSVVAEIGSDQGSGTELLATWCQQHGALLHVIDPQPKYDADEWAARWPTVVEFHVDLSLNALETIPPPDVVLIDGDHNWYTVFHELQLLDRIAAEHDRGFPVTLLHDVGWPYGRRDLYYDPGTIPEEFRHPHRKGGLVAGQAALAKRGFNDSVHNAVEEGTPRNGVLTAVEDFIAERADRLQLHVIPGLHGLAMIVRRDAPPRLHDAVAQVLSADGLRRVLTVVETDRVERISQSTKALRNRAHVMRGLQAQLDESAREVAALRARLAQVEKRYNRLSNRRSVRVTLKAAALARPLFRLRRSSRLAR